MFLAGPRLTFFLFQCEETSNDLENIRQKLAQFRFDDPDQMEDVISDISFSLSEKSSTISQLQSVIDCLREKQQDRDTELVSLILTKTE